MLQRRLPNDWLYLQVFSAVMVFASTLLVAFTNFAAISSFRDLQPPNTDWHKQGDSLQSHDVVVDLGYEIYAGVANDSTRLNVFKG
jgi:hypothetical protein